MHVTSMMFIRSLRAFHHKVKIMAGRQTSIQKFSNSSVTALYRDLICKKKIIANSSQLDALKSLDTLRTAAFQYVPEKTDSFDEYISLIDLERLVIAKEVC